MADSHEKRTRTQDMELPQGRTNGAPAFGSDLVASELNRLGIDYVALNPGASFRGLQDSVVNFLGNRKPQVLLCLHEGIATSLAHGYAKVTGRAMAVAVHSNVGLFHATMALFNAYCDRMPMLLLGATGPVDAARRRPWIDWLHTAADQGAVVRNYVKWDDQPASPRAAQEALRRAVWLANSAPCAPTYINFDADVQEQALGPDAEAPTAAERFVPRIGAAPPEDELDAVGSLLKDARAPLLLVGRTTRDESDWAARIALAEALDMKVLTDLRVGAGFPTDHRLHAAPAAIFPRPEARATIRHADVIVSLDWVDLAGTLSGALGKDPLQAKVVQVSLDHQLHNGWSKDHQAHPPVDHYFACESGSFVRALLRNVGANTPDVRFPPPSGDAVKRPALSPEARPDVPLLAATLRHLTRNDLISLLRLPLSWRGEDWTFTHPLDYLGGHGGGGIGGGPGAAVGSALALRDSGRLPVAICGDGDFLMSPTALWTATHYRIPLLMIVANNQSLYNDEVHQERVARHRGRPIENKWIGQRIADPEIDIASIATGQGAEGIGPVVAAGELEGALARSLDVVRQGGVAVVDVRVGAGGAKGRGAGAKGTDVPGSHD